MDDMSEFTHKLRHSGAAYEVGLLPLVGLQRRRADWGRAEGWRDEIYEWHGLVVAVRMRNASSYDLHGGGAGNGEGREGDGDAAGVFPV